jgi:hypothetical protein
MPSYAMACLACGTPLNDDGSCPNCGATSHPPAAHRTDAGREFADVTGPPGGAVLPGRADRLGVFQATRQPTNWFVRSAVVVAAIVFGLVVAGIIGVDLVAVLTGVWLLPHQGGAAVIGAVILVGSLLVLTAIGTMLWLLVRGGTR